MYYIDTLTYHIVSFDFDPDNGEIYHPKTVISVPTEHGAPDGMCIDEEGMLWIAHWGGANVSRWNPDSGELITMVNVPALLVTSCCFGGKNLDTLYITSARVDMSPDDMEKYPLSGSVFSFKPNVCGAKVNFFTPKPS
ncbi:MAG: SMP-30/gluconolactonase/LRE family protein [Bacteroidales bacterium]|nr:SMP-30/gluconolactonase/LRE family protein [Bacteroidales bacterium]